MISWIDLFSMLDYHPKTGIWVWVKPVGRRNTEPGYQADIKGGSGYRAVYIGKRQYLAHRLAWFYMTASWPPATIDHKNGKRSDNRWKNLRLATNRENLRNRKIHKNNTTGYKGVSWDFRRQKYFARIIVDGKYLRLGYFCDPKKAHTAYRRAAKIHFGEFARVR